MRPKKKESEKRRNRIDVRFTDEEYGLLMAEMSKTTNRTKGDFIREKLFKRDISASHILEQKAFVAAGELSETVNKIGVNYNQLVHAVNTYKHINFNEEDRKVMLITGQLIGRLLKRLDNAEL
mgnify:CR=1 FL=1